MWIMRKKQRAFGFVIILAIFAFVVVAILLSPLFRIENIEVIGNTTIPQSNILEASRIDIGDSMFGFNIGRVARDIAALSYVHSVEVLRHLPRGITINIYERLPAASVRISTPESVYLIVDNVGMVLEVAQSPATFGIPKLVGLDVEGFAAGQYLPIENAAISDIVLLLHIFEAYDFSPSLVDFSNPQGIFMTYGLFEIDFGGMLDVERKVRYLSAIVQNNIHNRGFIDIRNPDSHPRLRILQ